MDSLKEWFLSEMRSFPWRENRTPYRVWISEVMLQQTRAEVVVGYFERWMDAFPDIFALARAETEEVIKLWEGLGYYSRARNLHLGAKEIVEKYNGLIPNTLNELLKIRGIGPYTAGAILSFAFRQKAAALDGNVTRVLSRYLAFEKDALKYAKELREKLYEILPDKDPHVAMEGLIELGATVCKKKASCSLCPLSHSCLASKEGREEEFPILNKEIKRETIYRFVACIEYKGEFLLIKRGEKEVMRDLYEFPYIACNEDPTLFSFQNKLEKSLGLKLTPTQPLQRQKHTFTRFTSHLFPFHFSLATKKEVPGHTWTPLSLFQEIPFSSGHKKIAFNFLSSLRPF